LNDAKEYIQSAWSKQRDYLLSGTRKSRPRMLVASKAAFLENYLAVSTWTFDGSSIEYHEKKRQRFSLSGVRFGSGFKFLERSTLQRVVLTVNANPPSRSNSPFGAAKLLRAKSLSRKHYFKFVRKLEN